MKQLVPFLKPYRRMIVFSLLLMTVSTAGSLLLPTVMSEILNKGITGADLDYVLKCCGVMFVIALVSLAAVIGGSFLSTRVVSGFCADLRNAVFRKVNTMTFEEISEIGTAGLLSRTTHDVGTLSWIVSMLTQSVITIPILFVGGILLCLRKDVVLSLIFLCFLPVILAVVLRIGRKVEPLWELSDKYIDKQNELVRERLHGIRVIRAFNREGHEHERIAEATHTMAEYIIKSNLAGQFIEPLAMVLLNVAAVIMAYVGAVRMQGGDSALSGGDIFAIIQYVGLVTGGVVGGAFAIVMMPHSKVAAKRIGEVLNAKGLEGENDAVGAELPVFRGGIRFENVSFSYEGADEPALADISLEIRPGEKIALIGGTGSGKSTLVQLLLGFRRPSSGKLYFDETDSAQLSPKVLRKNISPVLQKAAIFSGTIRENVLMGRAGASDEEVREALRTAQILDFVESQPDGLDTKLEQAGKNLSGGQKQRLSIARAILKDAPVYIFDDSFSALDFLTEARLAKALEEKHAGRTKLVVTQRVSTARRCDRIYVLNEGRLAGAGSHEELMAGCPVYREICLSQNREVAE